MSRLRLRLPLLSLCLLVLGGADGCPVSVGSPSSSGQGSSAGGSSLDVGGQSGALWQLQFEQEVLVTLRLASGQAAAQKVPLHGGEADLLGETISVGDFCWRTDVVCPQGVLPEQTAIQQPAAGALLVGINRRGPLAAVSEAAMTGTISGEELTVPLAVDRTRQGVCPLGTSSAVLASAYAANGSRADSLQGRVTVAYDGVCASLGGTAVSADSRIELSVGFSGQRL